MNNIVVSDNIKIENMIYEIRGKQVMLDSDLAMLYGCKNGTKSLNLAVKRHINRFPERFMFQLTKEEYSSIYSRFQFETLNKNNQKQGFNIKYLPYVFTEQGVAMLSAVLKADVAEEVSIKIMDAFVAIIKIIIIDNYAGKELFDITKNIMVNIKVYTKNIDEIAIKKYRQEYSNIEIINTDIFHDRFIILDNSELYNIGSSLKDIGKKCSSINKIEDNTILKGLISRLEDI